MSMTDLQQPPTTRSGSKGNVGRWPLETPPPAEHVSYDQEMVGRRYGWVEIIRPDRLYVYGWSQAYVATRCVGCGREQWTSFTSLTRGVSKGCQRCSQPRRIPRSLDRVLTAAKQRCTNPHDPSYPYYGGRGITFDFESVLAAGVLVMENLGSRPPKGELDRVDNSRGYSPGNLRWVTRAQNVANRRNTRLTEFHQDEWPYAENTVRRLLSEGMSREEILERAHEAVQNKRKNWRGIEARLTSMTSPTLVRGIATPRPVG